MKEIRLLRADEIDVRIQSSTARGSIFLLYKDARCDMRILDETFGIYGWQRIHEVINGSLFCTVEIWDNDKQMWISKQDVGTESNTEKEKGQASDSFKRACFNLGIGRELYTAPFIWIAATDNEDLKKLKLHVSSIAYNDRNEIAELEIKDDKGRVRYSSDRTKMQTNTQTNAVDNTQPNVIDNPSSVIFEVIDMASSTDELLTIWNTYPQYQSNQRFKDYFTNAKTKLNTQQAS